MALFRTGGEGKRSLWKRVVDLALTDVKVLAGGGLGREALDDLEEKLLAADFGVTATVRLVDHLEGLVRRGKARTPADLVAALRAEASRILAGAAAPPSGTPDGARPGSDLSRDLALADGGGPTVYLVVGVNGVGKTTSIAKLAHRLIAGGRSVLVAAGDTYRAGAIAQLEEWAGRVGADFVRGAERGDPAAVAFDALEAAVSRGTDVVLVDTAGRLHTHAGLVEELRKVHRVIGRRIQGAPHETLLVLDATVGQNALSQVKTFREVVAPTGIVLTKLDSTARGGIVVAIAAEFGVPVKLVGVGEGVEDLEPFDVDAFLDGVFGGE